MTAADDRYETPTTQAELLARLRVLARGAGPGEDERRALREAVQAGALADPDGARVEDAEGRAAPVLHWAARWGDGALVQALLERGARVDSRDDAGATALHAALDGDADPAPAVAALLAAGASPIAARGDGVSVLRLAHRRAETPEGRARFHSLRQAAFEAARQRALGLAAVATGPSERRYEPTRDRGLNDLRARAARLDVLLVQHDLKTTAGALARLSKAPRRESDASGRSVADAARLLFVLRLRGVPWTIVPCVVEEGSPWAVTEVPELPTRGPGVVPLARALAEAAQARVLHVERDRYTAYEAHGAIQAHLFAVDPLWAPSDGPLPTEEEARALLPGFEGPADALREAAAERRELLRTIDATMAELEVLLPPMRVTSDGVHVQVQLLGVEPAAVERVDVVVLQELGDPAVDRRPAEAAAPALAIGGQAPLEHAPPPRVAPPEPPPVAAAPASHAPPPLVADDQPTRENVVSGAPPPPRVGAGVGAKAPPPLVREPPPLVTESPARPGVDEAAGGAAATGGDEPGGDDAAS